MSLDDVYIVDGCRTAIGAIGKTLSSVRPDDLGAVVVKAIVERTGANPEAIEDVVFGCTNQAGEDNRDVARMSLLLAGLPQHIGGTTVNRLCGSSMDALHYAARAIMTGDGDVMIAGGVESMSRAPMVMPKAETAFPRANVTMYNTTLGWRFPNPKMEKMFPLEPMGETAENIYDEMPIPREEQDEFALASQENYQAAHEANKFADEIVPVEIPQRKGDPIVFEKDEHPRATSMEKLAALRPAFRKDGSVTAGNASGLNDGAAALMVSNSKGIDAHGWTPMVKVKSMAIAGVNPRTMGLGPIPATQKALDRAGLSVDDIGLVELNEAFAVQSLACVKELGLPKEIVNVNGGAIALGHPLGCSGARIITTLIHEMKRRSDVKYGLATMCIGVGQGIATIFERVE